MLLLNFRIKLLNFIYSQINNTAALQQLMLRIKQLEEQEHQLSTEADELREQNELLEFRILELEETNDKVSKVKPKSMQHKSHIQMFF